ncbi:MAG: ATP-binding cassette domain-containing protein, partial [Chloroflexota bacterium]
EILGIAGLIGAGRTELARAIFGADRKTGGQIEINGEPVDIQSPRDAIRYGVGLVPEDRKQQALFLTLAVEENLSIAALPRLSTGSGFIRAGKVKDLIEHYREALKIRMASPQQRVRNLSGGNQQKVVIARWLALQPQILIVDEPTRGIDVAAKAEVHQLLDNLAKEGIAVVMISSELPEILSMSDRIITIREGRLTGEFTRTDATEETLMQAMMLDTAS